MCGSRSWTRIRVSTDSVDRHTAGRSVRWCQRRSRSCPARERRHGGAREQISRSISGLHCVAADERHRCRDARARTRDGFPARTRNPDLLEHPANRSTCPEYQPILRQWPLTIFRSGCTRSADIADYPTEERSLFEIWWTLGWPYESSVAMSRLVFSGIFDRHPNLKIITHHMGGMIPYFEGASVPRLGSARHAHVRPRLHQAAEGTEEAVCSTTSRCSTPTRRPSAPTIRRCADCASSA